MDVCRGSEKPGLPSRQAGASRMGVTAGKGESKEDRRQGGGDYMEHGKREVGRSLHCHCLLPSRLSLRSVFLGREDGVGSRSVEEGRSVK